MMMQRIKPKVPARGNSKRIKVKCLICRTIFYHKPNFKTKTCGSKCSLLWQDLHHKRQNTDLRNKKCINRMFTGELKIYKLTV